MINGLNSAAFFDSLNNYSLYNNTDDNLFTNPYTNIQSEIANPVETGDLFSEQQSLFDVTDFESSSVVEMQQSVEEFEFSLSEMENKITQVEDSLSSGSQAEILESTENLVESYNQTLTSLRENSNYNSIQAADDLSNTAELAAEELNNIGIEIDQFGQLEVNTEEFETALTENVEELRSVMSSETGFLSDLLQQISSLEEEPPATFMDFDSELALYSAEDTAENMLENGLIVDMYS
ncbi:flagellar filament capping protein FliD [Halanaerobium sp.]|uniref:flagellar filament capping protein FliD n=1 Tax=Halanaerobium sp. TaxID=1895664 RepID=UPI000DE61F7D|nr:flagellar filament capping protein FliD [Halanaerobium sp.]PUU95483.1 MAG: hypothetical protein CI949_111 [Halanaerobium sp.]PUU95706.1 MAG: hypothetical protein CI947_67 [Halanaerobium sp.]